MHAHHAPHTHTHTHILYVHSPPGMTNSRLLSPALSPRVSTFRNKTETDKQKNKKEVGLNEKKEKKDLFHCFFSELVWLLQGADSGSRKHLAHYGSVEMTWFLKLYSALCKLLQQGFFFSYRGVSQKTNHGSDLWASSVSPPWGPPALQLQDKWH